MRNAEFTCISLLCAFCLTMTRVHDSRLHVSDVQAAVFGTPTCLEKTAYGGTNYLNQIVFIVDSRTYG